jgi:hypothetical protein
VQNGNTTHAQSQISWKSGNPDAHKNKKAVKTAFFSYK